MTSDDWIYTEIARDDRLASALRSRNIAMFQAARKREGLIAIGAVLAGSGLWGAGRWLLAGVALYATLKACYADYCLFCVSGGRR